VQPNASDREIELVRKAASIAGVRLIESDVSRETETELAKRLGSIGSERMRVVGDPVGAELRAAANSAAVHAAEQPVLPVGRVELLHYVREQAISRTLHRFGNLIS
jgi:RHH-type proline utilization regulon transcriptional repressor/proline dehydrogenase/delta 1-pyrroline-5-carboxylate dehydrogenase